MFKNTIIGFVIVVCIISYNSCERILPPQIFLIINNNESRTINFGKEQIGTIELFRHDYITSTDSLVEVEEGVFEWRRTFRCTSPNQLDSVRLTLDFIAGYKTEYAMIPAVSYNGNFWGKGNEPKGFFKDGQPWSFAYHRTAVAGATYSEGTKWSVALFSSLGKDKRRMTFSCSLIPEKQSTIHRLIWPEEEKPFVYRNSNEYTEGYQNSLILKPGEEITVKAWIVVNPVSIPRTSWHKFLDFAWKVNHHHQKPWFESKKIWQLGVHYAKENLWAEEGIYKGFSKGLIWDGKKWVLRPFGKYVVGWTGQNISLANSLLYDYLRSGDSTSLSKGISCIDCWANNASLDNGLFRCVFDPILSGTSSEQEVQDACKLGSVADGFFEAYDLAEKCALKRPLYLDIAYGICDFAVGVQGEDGKLGKAWLNDGRCVEANGTIGCFFVPPLISAYIKSENDKYLEAAEKSYTFYANELLSNGFTTAGAIDMYCIDKESAFPLLKAGLALYEITKKNKYLKLAENAAYYLVSWQWHHSVPFPEGSTLFQLGYDTFGGTSISTQGHHLDPYGIRFVKYWLRLADLTENDLWRQRALAVWANGTIGVSDGNLEIMGKKRPAGSQDEGFHNTQYNDAFNVDEWLVAWPNAFRLETLRYLPDWSILNNKQITTAGDNDMKSLP